MKKPVKKYGLLVLAFVVFVCLNYNPHLMFETSYFHWGWNFALLATLLIILIFRIRDPFEWKQKLGISFNKKDFLGFVISTIVLLVGSYFLVAYLANTAGYSFRPQLFFYKDLIGPDYPFGPILGNYLYYIPETFNEEMLIGAVLLMGLERKFKKLNKNIIAVLIALIFSLMHQFLYKYSPAQPEIILTTSTLLTLFFVGLLRNVIILKTRKITYSWAIHLSFNLIFFAGHFINKSTKAFASEPERFNIVFGNIPMLIFTGLLAFVSLIWLNINSKKVEQVIN